ncbi:hypothetical protein BC739_001741 [Kutzneria viridogrisea]|uniref:Uncharacterized protein n=1 Tax=Kutzneria viridogrisea TaxID=47990 RepID=A0ABR6BCE8_9PSEU|nr:hypothetical protein [Kutzneria viridogrisea]
MRGDLMPGRLDRMDYVREALRDGAADADGGWEPV